ncbi:hypothetical protein [Sphingomonas sp. BK580]|uniref:hypothetical protein n=1 Tax=Sphingomonas sp. BK580 TaxID=2586972 RepID=UPI00162075C2|nr:hypothetical protein [Sphingomonas sp. BK580]MBB3692485.1 hypothetical protein [Sphingomonas sp. BK580]
MKISTRLHARLLDNHTLINPAKALFAYGSPDYYELIQGVRKAAFRSAARLPRDVSIILTNVLASGGPSDYAFEHWQAIRALATERKVPLLSVTLDCEPGEQARRMVAADRKSRMKMTDPSVIQTLRESRRLFDDGADHRLSIDNTRLSASGCADQILRWIKEMGGLGDR